MRKLMALLVILIAAIFVFSASCSNKNSTEACHHETSMNLDKGNYDAVLASACADSMQVGAAWFGKAGYDIKDVLNRFIDANSSNQTKSDLNIYMTSLTGNVTALTLTDLDNARGAYVLIPDTDSGYQDAQFYVGLVDAIKSLAIIKIAIPNAVNPDGTLNKTCDKNGNNVPDEADATACALIVSDIISKGSATTCTNAVYSRSTPTDIAITDPSNQTVSGIYSGLTITITGSGASCGTDTYNRLLYTTDHVSYWVATTTAELCTGSDGKTYHCPIPGPNIDFVSTVNASIDNSISALSTALTGTITDVQQSILDVKAEACCGCLQSPCGPCGNTCTSSDIAAYLQNNLQ